MVSFKKSDDQEGLYLEVGDPDFSKSEMGSLSYAFVSDDYKRGLDWKIPLIQMTLQGKEV